MRKLLFTFALTLLTATGAWAQTTFTVDNLKYTVTDDTANTVKLTDYETQPTGTLDIPASVSYYDTEYSVTSIGGGAFQYCSALTQVNIPDGVTSIGNYAFYECSALTQVNIGNSVTSIGEYAFSRCSKLTQVNIGNSVTSIGEYAFSRCSKLTQVNIPNSVTSIGNSAFEGCSALKQVTIGSGVTSIGSSVFYNCSALAEMTVLATVPPTITANTFSDINPQVKVSVPEGSRDAYMADENWKWLLDLSAGQLSGTCGDNLTWTFTTADSTLTISGTGDMYDYNYSNDQPWYNFNQGIKNISLQDGATSIGDHAFEFCSALRQINIPDGVTSIGYEAFEGCSALTAVYYTGDVAGWCGITFTSSTSNPLSCAHNLYIGNTLVTELVIPEGVTEIKSCAFYSCSATQVTIPGSVTSIGDAAFSECSALTQVTLPDGVTSIGNSAFEGCSALAQVTIGDGVTSIGDSAFEGCSALTQITIGNSVTSIGSSAFRYCSALTQVTIPDGVTSIGDYAFRYCSALTQVNIGNSVTSIGDYAFCNCSALRQVTIPDGVTSIGKAMFGVCSALKQVTIGNSVTSIGDYAFSDCYALKQITLPESVTSIGDEAFSDCYALAEITVLPTVPPTIRAKTFYKINLQVNVSVPEGSRDAYMADESWKKLLDLSAGEISGTCLYNLTWTFTTADSTLTISGTGDMYDYYYSNGQPWYEFNQAIKNISIQDGVTSIGERAFAGCSKLTQVTLPESVTSIGYEAFSECSALTAVYYTGDVAGWCGITFTSSTSNPLSCAHNLYIGNTLVTELVIPEGVTEIKDCAFYGCSATQVSIPDGVTNIGDYAFRYCSALTQITIGNGVTSIGDYAFANCSALTQITIGNGVTSIGNYAFSYCSALTQVTIPGSVESIGYAAFAYCSALKQVNIGDGVTSIGEWTFGDCSALTQVTLPNSVESIGHSAFRNCSALTQVTIPNSVTSIGSSVFSDCSALTQVTIGSGVTSIGSSVFYNCSALAEMTVLPTVPPTITASTFSNINPQVKVSIPEGSKDAYMADENWKWLLDLSAGQLSGTCGDNLTWTFTTADCTLTISGTGDMYDYNYSNDQPWYNFNQGIKNISLQDGVTSIGDHAFEFCSALTQVNIPNNVESIGDMAFAYCSALRQVTIGSGVTSIGYEAFRYCSALAEMTVLATVPPTITASTFYNINLQVKVSIPEGSRDAYMADENWKWLLDLSAGQLSGTCGDNLTWTFTTADCTLTISGTGDMYSFSYQPWGYFRQGIKNISLPDGVTSIGSSAFKGCSALAEMTVLATVPPTVGYNAFYDVNREIPVYVPAEALEDYWVAAVWEEFYYLQAMPANALQTPSMPESIRIEGGMLHNPQQLPVSIYDMQGRMVYSGTAATVSQPAGVYVVLCAGASRKVLF